MSTLEELMDRARPCPFCGSTDLATTIVAGEPRHNPRAVECIDCGIEGPATAGANAAESEASAWDRWNGTPDVVSVPISESTKTLRPI